ncbi:hypothetical protein Amsp01_063160 [Amycolatopsis sp. NBRC 101858]|nr:hypothetical protein Amsp01_063160 [Amycolatopsis sp. NBRC 101858]
MPAAIGVTARASATAPARANFLDIGRLLVGDGDLPDLRALSKIYRLFPIPGADFRRAVRVVIYQY